MKALKLSKAKSTVSGMVGMLATAVAAVAAVSAEPLAESAGTPIQAVDGVIDIGTYYQPTGKIGDIGDIGITQGKFIYTANGEGKHEWDYKFIDGKENPEPAGFAGCCWIHPDSDWGKRDGGCDFRKVPPHKITWQARCIGEPFPVKFLVGGNNWVWEGNKKVTPPYPETMSQLSLGVKDLTEEWQDFEAAVSFPPGDERLRRVVFGFGWTISPGDLDGRKYEFEVREVHYHVLSGGSDGGDIWKWFLAAVAGVLTVGIIGIVVCRIEWLSRTWNRMSTPMKVAVVGGVFSVVSVVVRELLGGWLRGL